MTTQLFIYNEALGHLGERVLASLTEGREPRRVLDSYWSDVVAYALAGRAGVLNLRAVHQHKVRLVGGSSSRRASGAGKPYPAPGVSNAMSPAACHALP